MAACMRLEDSEALHSGAPVLFTIPFPHAVEERALTLLADGKISHYMRTAYALSILGCLVRRCAESHIIGTNWGSERERIEIALRTFHSIPHSSLSELR